MISIGAHVLLLFCAHNLEKPRSKKYYLDAGISWHPQKEIKLAQNKLATSKNNKKSKNNNKNLIKIDNLLVSKTHEPDLDSQVSITLTARDKPELINGDDVHVAYPAKARYRKIEGRVRLLLTVAQSGRVINASILSSPSHDLQQAALKLAQKLIFLPATDAFGQALVAQIEHDVVFRLN